MDADRAAGFGRACVGLARRGFEFAGTIVHRRLPKKRECRPVSLNFPGQAIAPASPGGKKKSRPVKRGGQTLRGTRRFLVSHGVFGRSMPSDLIRGWKPVRVKKTRQKKKLV